MEKQVGEIIKKILSDNQQSKLIYEFDRWHYFLSSSKNAHDEDLIIDHYLIKSDRNEEVIVITKRFHNIIIFFKHLHKTNTDAELAFLLTEILIDKLSIKYIIHGSCFENKYNNIFK